MYELEKILPEDQFVGIMSRFSIDTAQAWLEEVKDLVGAPCYDSMKEAFQEQEEKNRKKMSEMNCLAELKACGSRETKFQLKIGADRYPNVDMENVDDVFTGYFVGV